MNIMWEKIVAFFMSIIAFFASLFGFDTETNSYEYRNLAYGNHERQVLDLNIPKDNDGEIGLVLFIHGGAWIMGDKESYKAGVKASAETYGFAGAAINYRYISEDVSIHDILDDIDLALKCIKQKGEENGVNINKVLLTGDSAGGHLSLLYAYSRASTAAITPTAVVSNSGPTDFTDESFYINNAIGDEEFVSTLFSWASGKTFAYEDRATAKDALESVSPLFYVNKNTVPTVINHGMKDSIVPYSNAVSLEAKLTQYGVTHVLNSYPNSDHDLGNDESNKKIANDLLINYCITYLN